jgi:hypothetical protein
MKKVEKLVGLLEGQSQGQLSSSFLTEGSRFDLTV